MNDPMNPSLRQLPRHEPAELIPSSNEVSLLEWLQATGRLIPREEEERTTQQKEELEELGLIEDDSYSDSDSNSADDSDEEV